MISEPMLFQTRAYAPKFPEKCHLPTVEATASKQRRLGESLAREAAETACAEWPSELQNMCIYDVLMTRDFELAQAGAH